MVRYANMLKLPLLVAWRFGNIWTLLDVRLLEPSPIRYKIEFDEAIKNTLMTELAATFRFGRAAGCT